MTTPKIEDSELVKKLKEYNWSSLSDLQLAVFIAKDLIASQTQEAYKKGYVDGGIEMSSQVTAAEKAYGGCHKCYGKGYATVNDCWIGYDTDTDIGSPGGIVRGGEPIAMKYCDCERGKQLSGLIASHRPQTTSNLNKDNE